VQVDVIVSEWMGYCLLYEAMFDSVLLASMCHLPTLLLASHLARCECIYRLPAFTSCPLPTTLYLLPSFSYLLPPTLYLLTLYLLPFTSNNLPPILYLLSSTSYPLPPILYLLSSTLYHVADSI